MHGFKHLSVLCVAAALAAPAPAAAAGFARVGTLAYSWEGVFTSGRLSALGGADLADAGPATVLVNPAPLAGEDAVALSFDHADYLADLEFRTWAGAAAWRGWRLNVAVQDLLMDPQLVRTAYNPEGTGETFEVRERATCIGLSAEPGRFLLPDSSLRWSVGAAWRRYESGIDSVSSDTDALDLGTTLGWRAEHPGGWTGLTGAVSWQNVTDATLAFDGRSAHLPGPLRVGATAEVAWRRDGREGDFCKFLLAYTRAVAAGESYRGDSDHVGAELMFLDALALRWGHSTRVAGGITGWGAGIVLDGRLLGPFTVAADLGNWEFDNDLLKGNRTIWGVRAQYRF